MNYLFAGYLVIWTLISLYLWYLSRRQREIEARLRSMEERVEGG